MNYDGYNNEEIAYVVAFAVAHENCEEARRLFEDKYGRAAPPVRTKRDWRTRFIQTLSVLPRSHAGDQSKRRVSEEKQAEIVGACLLYTSPSPRDLSTSRMPSSA